MDDKETRDEDSTLDVKDSSVSAVSESFIAPFGRGYKEYAIVDSNIIICVEPEEDNHTKLQKHSVTSASSSYCRDNVSDSRYFCNRPVKKSTRSRFVKKAHSGVKLPRSRYSKGKKKSTKLDKK